MYQLTPWLKRLLIANAAVYVVTLTSPGLRNDLAFYAPAAIYRPWTIVTYMFLHGGTGHLLFNMLGLFIFGGQVEQRMGGRAFLWMYFVAGAVGAILQTIWGLFGVQAFMVGASGGVFGVMMSYAVFWPRQELLLFPIMIPVQARFLVGGYIVLSLFFGFGATQDGIAHFAHLGGALGAFLYIKWWEWSKGADKRAFQRKRLADASPSGIMGDRVALQRWQSIRVEEMHELNRGEVQRLLQKVDEEGPKGLTQQEREFLDRMSAE